jgi:release factor glutamine methyltransferase
LPVKILDLGTGSGAIAVTVAKHLPHAEVWASDISAAALRVAAANAKRHAVEKRVRFVAGDLFAALDPGRARFDVIVANPPYIASAELPLLAPEICGWEPVWALDGGFDGLDYYRRIIAAAPHYLRERGTVLLETGSQQAEAVINLCVRTGCYLPARSHRDLAGRDRVVAATKGAVRG